MSGESEAGGVADLWPYCLARSEKCDRCGHLADDQCQCPKRYEAWAFSDCTRTSAEVREDLSAFEHDIVATYRAGTPVGVIENLYDMKPSTVRHIVTRHDCEGCRRLPGRAISRRDIAAIRSLHDAGMPPSDIARSKSVARTTIWKVIDSREEAV